MCTGFGVPKKFFLLNLILFLFTVLILGSTPSYAQKSDSLFYTVQPGDFLVKIGVNYGNPNFWRDIYEANRDQLIDPNLIYPEQELFIPQSVTQSRKFSGTYTATKDSLEEKATLEEFRKAFQTLVNSEKAESTKVQQKSNNGLEFGGLVIDETKSKMGKIFFDIFYRFWEAPPDAPNFLLSITERPIPSMGTLVTVKLDNQPIFRTKLQPRYEIIEQEAKRAVAISYRSLQQKLQTENQLIRY